MSFVSTHTPEVGPVTQLVLDKESNLAMFLECYQRLCGYLENPKVTWFWIIYLHYWVHCLEALPTNIHVDMEESLLIGARVVIREERDQDRVTLSQFSLSGIGAITTQPLLTFITSFFFFRQGFS